MQGSSFVSDDSHTDDYGQVCVADKLLCNICDLEPLRDPVVTSSVWSSRPRQTQLPPRVVMFFVGLACTSGSIGITSRPRQTQLPPRVIMFFCWPCLYQWLHRHHRDQKPCPVCKNVLKDFNILPIYGKHKVHGGKDVSSNMGTVADVANSGGFIIPPRPSPPEDALTLSSRKYATSDGELENDDEFESHDEFDFPENFDPNDDMSTSNEESGDEPDAELMESLVLAVRREMGERTFHRFEPALRSFLSREL